MPRYFAIWPRQALVTTASDRQARRSPDVLGSLTAGHGIGATLDREFHVDQATRVIQGRLRHQQGQILALEGCEPLRQPFRQRWRDAFERLVEQQAFGANGKRAAERDQLLLSAAQQ